MIKLDEIIWNTPIPVMVDEVEARYPIETIKEIAIEYAKLCLEKAAEEAYMDDDGKDYQPHFWIVKESITNIKLP